MNAYLKQTKKTKNLNKKFHLIGKASHAPHLKKKDEKKRESFFVWLKAIISHQYFLPLCASSLFFVCFFMYLFLAFFVGRETIIQSPFLLQANADYPLLTGAITPTISAEAALIMDADSHVVVFSKNPNVRFSPASTTKIMTALTGLATYSLSDVLTIKTGNIEPVVVGFLPGQRVTFENLLYGMLVPSGNDAAIAVAQNYPAGVNAFLEKMNENARRWHLDNTHFADAAGLTDDFTYTTVTDLANLAAIAMQNKTFAKIVGTKETVVATTDGSQFLVKNKNVLLGLYGVTGIKTGYTDEAREVLVTSVVRENHTYIIVVMRSQDRFADTINLIQTVVDTIIPVAIHL